jgi:hypothetical protein
MNIKYTMAILKNIKFFKNIFITTGITFIFGMYSIYHLYFYMKQIDNKINNLNKKEIDYKQLELEIIKINNNIDILSDRLIELETKNTMINETELTLNDLSEVAYNIKYYSNCEEVEESSESKKIGDYTCISMEEIANEEKDNNEESVRSRSSSLNWVKKTLFG